METYVTEKMIIRDLKMRTNHNHKLDCDRFIHIQPSPRNGIPESLAEKTLFKITTADSSHPTTYAQIHDSCKQRLQDISAPFVWLSHGMEKSEFMAMVLRDLPGASASTEMTIYFYKKVTYPL